MNNYKDAEKYSWISANMQASGNCDKSTTIIQMFNAIILKIRGEIHKN